MAAFSVTGAMVSWLASRGHAASATVPRDPPASFLTVERVGGSVSGMVDSASIAVQAWAPTDALAEELANEVRLLAVSSPAPPGVHSVRVEAGPYRFYDEATRCPRYQLVLRVACQLEI